MKRILLISFICACQIASAKFSMYVHPYGSIFFSTHYYVSAAGADGNSGTSTGSPWQHISKVNSSSFVAGDTISFRCGDTWNEQLKLPSSGSSGNAIVINSYNSGNKPIISGFTSISSGSWASIGGNLYTVSVGAIGATVYSNIPMITLDGFYQSVSTYPKNGRYFNINSSAHANAGDQDTINNTSTTTNNDSLLTNCPSLTGTPEVVWRPFNWVLWRGTITGQTSTAIYYNALTAPAGGATEQPVNSQGFFVQNSPAICNVLGDWAYNSSTKVLTMYFPSGPTGHTVQSSTIDTLINLNSKNWITFDGIDVQGANTYNIYSGGSTNIVFKNGKLSLAGMYGSNAQGSSTTWTFTNDTIRCINSNGLYQAFSSTAHTITNNFFDSIGCFRGMGGSGEIQYVATRGRSSNDIENNTLKHCGYIPIYWDGTNNTVQQNFVDTFGFVKDDAGGIYCGTNDMTGTIINQNIVFHGLTSAPGTSIQTDNYGIYLDDGAHNVKAIQNNTAAFCSNAGFYCHNCHEDTLQSNTFWDNGFAQDRYINDAATIANITYKFNVTASRTNSEFEVSTSASTTGHFAVRDTNYYARGTDTTNDFRKDGVAGSFNTWQTALSKDLHSTHKLVSNNADFKFVYNATAGSKTVLLSGYKWLDLKGNSFIGSITLAAFGSAVLIKNGPIGGIIFKR